MIRLLVMDVDGTLTDGKIYMSENGEAFKAFDIKDGYGIKHILPKYGIIPVIITARESKIVERRCSELDISDCYQSAANKLDKLDDVIKKYSQTDGVALSYKNIAYIGDDILDLHCMLPIQGAGGVVGCPADAVKEVREISDFVASKNGGAGAVREFIDFVLKIE